MKAWAGEGAAVIHLTSERDIKDPEEQKDRKERDYSHLKEWSKIACRLEEIS